MSLDNPVSMLEVHSELSCILHAASLEFEDCNAHCYLQYRNNTYLSLVVEVWNKKDMDKVILRLKHGFLKGPYDYRFSSITHPPRNSWTDESPPYWVQANINLSTSKRTGRS